MKIVIRMGNNSIDLDIDTEKDELEQAINLLSHKLLLMSAMSKLTLEQLSNIMNSGDF